MKIAKWGNSLAVRLPAAVTNALRLKEGDEIEIHVAGAREFGVARKPGREDFLNQVRAYRGRLPPDFKFDRAEANARYFIRREYSYLSRVRRCDDEGPTQLHQPSLTAATYNADRNASSVGEPHEGRQMGQRPRHPPSHRRGEGAGAEGWRSGRHSRLRRARVRCRARAKAHRIACRRQSSTAMMLMAGRRTRQPIGSPG
jgi:antitoxin MazE